MFYLKKESGEIPIYGDEIFTRCIDCKKEIYLGEQELAEIINDDFEFAGTSVICEECTKKRNSQKTDSTAGNLPGVGNLIFLRPENK